MTRPADITLSRHGVRGTCMAYPAARATRTPVALFLHGHPTSCFI